MPRASMEIRGPDTSSVGRVQRLKGGNWLIWTRSKRSFSHTVKDLLTLPVAPAAAALGCCYRNSITLTLCQPCPNATSHLVSQCNSYEHSWLAFKQTGQPRPFRSTLLICPPDDSHRADNEQSSNVALSHFRCPPQAFLSS